MIIRLKKQEGSEQQSLNLFIAGLLLLPIYIDLMNTLSYVIGFNTKITTYAYYGVLWVLLFRSVPAILRVLRNKVLLAAAAIVVFTTAQYVLFPNNRSFTIGTSTERLVTFNPKTLLAVVPYLLIGYAVADIDKLRETLHSVSKIGVIMGTLAYVIAIVMGYRIRYDDMSNAYAVCVMVCFLITDYRKSDIRYLVMGAFCLVLAGTRGPVICVAVALICRILVVETAPVKKALKVSAGILVIFFMQSGLLAGLMNLIAVGFEAIGISNLRIINYFREGVFMDSSGRDEIMDSVIQAIRENPLVGYGPGGDRLFVDSAHTHNLFLEVWVSYGVVIGTALLCGLFYWLAKGAFSKNASLRIIVTAFFCSVVVKLFASSSYLYSKELFILLGLCMTGVAAQKRKMRMGLITQEEQNAVETDTTEEVRNETEA